MLCPVTEKRGPCPHLRVVDVAVQGLVHCKDELRHPREISPLGCSERRQRPIEPHIAPSPLVVRGLGTRGRWSEDLYQLTDEDFGALNFKPATRSSAA